MGDDERQNGERDYAIMLYDLWLFGVSESTWKYLYYYIYYNIYNNINIIISHILFNPFFPL